MKKIGNWVITLTVVALMGLMPASAFAEWENPAIERKVLKEAFNHFKTEVGLSTNIEYKLADGQGLGVGYSITIRLTGGAKFTNIPADVQLRPLSILCTLGGALPGGWASPQAYDTTNKLWARWSVTGGTLLEDQKLQLRSTNLIFDVSGVNIGGEVDVIIELRNNFDVLIAQANYSLDLGQFIFVGESASKVVTTPQTDQVKIASDNGPFTKFALDAVDGSKTKVDLTHNGSTDSVPPSLNFGTHKILYVLTGDFTGIEEVRVNPATIDLKGSDATGNPFVPGSEVNEFLINDANDAAYAVNNGILIAGQNLNTEPQFILDGTTTQLPRNFELCIYKLAEGTDWYAYTMLECITHYTITRDGSTRVLLNVPGGQATSADKGFVRISNPTERSGRVLATMYDQGGNIIGQANTVILANLGAQSTQVIDNEGLRQLFGNWAGRARMEIFAELPDLGVMGIIRSGDNMQNMSTGAGANWGSN